jgi:hypothetical protein
MARRPNVHTASEAIRAAIGAELKRLFSDVLREPVPEEMARLLRQLDWTPEEGQNTDNA